MQIAAMAAEFIHESTKDIFMKRRRKKIPRKTASVVTA